MIRTSSKLKDTSFSVLDEFFYIYLTEWNMRNSWFTVYGRGYHVNFRRMMIYYSESGEIKFRNIKRVSNELHANDVMANRMHNFMRGKAGDHERYD